MNLLQAQNTFALRLHRWCLADFIRELQNGCPLLSVVGAYNRAVAAFVSWSQTLHAADRVALARAMTLLFHENARKLQGLTITDDMQQWGEAFYDEVSRRMATLPPAPRVGGSSPSLSLDRFLQKISSLAAAELGQATLTPEGLCYSIQIEGWSVRTEYTFAKQAGEVSFQYQFVRADGTPVIEVGHGPFPRNLLAFYGIYPRTLLHVRSGADEEQVAAAVVRLAEHFIIGGKQLFVGLGPKD